MYLLYGLLGDKCYGKKLSRVVEYGVLRFEKVMIE